MNSGSYGRNAAVQLIESVGLKVEDLSANPFKVDRRFNRPRHLKVSLKDGRNILVDL